MSTTVHVAGISHETSEKEVRDFFSFCGKITNLSITPASNEPSAEKSASVTFEKETAAKTALLLDNTQLGKSQVKVTSASSIDEVAAKAGQPATSDEDHISQEDKPKSRIVAEYLAHGYALSDQIIEKAISADQKGGYSNRFTSALQNFDNKYKATDKAKEYDAKYKVSDKAMGAWNSLSSYFEKAMGTPTGQRLHAFYQEGDKQVRDVHNEARRLADLKSPTTAGAKPGSETTSTVGGDNKPITVDHTDGHTVCQCGGDTGHCPCAEGKCACKGCSKSSHEETVAAKEAAQATGQHLPEGAV